MGYPLNISLGIAMLRLLQGDAEPLSKLIFTLFLISVCLGILQFWLGLGVPPGHAVLAASFLSTVPVVFQHGTIGYVNLPFACYLTLGTIYLLEGIGEGSKSKQALGGLLLALSAWTRPDGLPISMLVLIGILGAKAACSWRSPHLWAVCGPLVAVAGPWQVYSWAVAPGAAQAATVDVVAGFMSGVARGQWKLDSFYWIARFAGGQLTDPTVWGVALPVGLLLILMRRKAVADRTRPISFALLIVTLVVSLQVVLFYYLLSFSADLIYWLGTDINRMMLPAGLLAWAWVVSMWSHPQTESPVGQEAR